MIRLRDILAEEAVIGKIQLHGIGSVTCKWDTGNTTSASALHATDIHVDAQQRARWRSGSMRYSAPCIGYSRPRGKELRPMINARVTWQGKTVNTKIALVDRSINSAEFLCNMDLMSRLGVHIDTTNRDVYVPTT